MTDELLVLTWLDRADRDVLAVHPRGDATRPETGDGPRLRVADLEALDGTPVLDLKPVLEAVGER